MSRLVIFLGMTIGILTVASHAGAAIVTDTTWRAIGPAGNTAGLPISAVGLAWENAHPGWNSSLLFDDSDAAGWRNAIDNGQPFDSPIPGSTLIWVDGDGLNGSTPAYFRKIFWLDGTPVHALLDFEVDDDAYVFVNGVKVIHDESGGVAPQLDVDVTAALQSGWNLIAVKAQDSVGSREWVAASLEASTVPEPTTLAIWSALGGLGLIAARRRRRTA